MYSACIYLVLKRGPLKEKAGYNYYNYYNDDGAATTTCAEQLV